MADDVKSAEDGRAGSDGGAASPAVASPTKSRFAKGSVTKPSGSIVASAGAAGDEGSSSGKQQHAGGGGGGGGANAGPRLYEQGLKAAERIAQWAEGEFRRKHPFKPQISDTAKRVSTRGPDIHKGLYMDAKARKAKYQARLEEIAAKEKAEFRLHLSPTLTTQAPHREGVTDVYQALYKNSVESRAKLEERQKAAEAKALRECTFRPQITPTAEPTMVPVTDRLYNKNELKVKAEIRESKRVQREMTECTFVPQISPTSRTLSAAHRDDSVSQVSDAESSASVHDRLYKAAQLSESRKKAAQDAADAKVAAECTFQPHTSVSSGTTPRASSDWHQRMFEVAAIREKKLREQREALYAKECPFKPTVHGLDDSTARPTGQALLNQLYLDGVARQRGTTEWKPPVANETIWLSQLRSPIEVDDSHLSQHSSDSAPPGWQFGGAGSIDVSSEAGESTTLQSSQSDVHQRLYEESKNRNRVAMLGHIGRLDWAQQLRIKNPMSPPAPPADAPVEPGSVFERLYQTPLESHSMSTLNEPHESFEAQVSGWTSTLRTPSMSSMLVPSSSSVTSGHDMDEGAHARLHATPLASSLAPTARSPGWETSLRKPQAAITMRGPAISAAHERLHNTSVNKATPPTPQADSASVTSQLSRTDGYV